MAVIVLPEICRFLDWENLEENLRNLDPGSGPLTVILRAAQEKKHGQRRAL